MVECQAKRVTYQIPPETTDVNKNFIINRFEKGRILYDINFAKCHNKKIKGKTYVPDFSQEVLMQYEMRTSNQEHEGEIPESRVTAEELNIINNYFLRYKKANPPKIKAVFDADSTMHHSVAH